MKKPDFYCESFIENHSNIKKYQPPDCKTQCHRCMDVIIDHHFNKKMTPETPKVLVPYEGGAKNHLPMTTTQYLLAEARCYKTTFWGEECEVEPCVIIPENIEIVGDSGKVVMLTPLATRPQFYLIVVDSHFNCEENIEELLDVIDEQLGRRPQWGYLEQEKFNELKASGDYEISDYDNFDDYNKACQWPHLNDTCGYMWEVVFNEPSITL